MNQPQVTNPTHEKLDKLSNQMQALTDAITAYTKDRRKRFDLSDTKMEQKTYNTYEETFSAYGYRYFGIYSEAARKLTISFGGFSYQVTLNVGFTSLPLIDGLMVKADQNFTGILVRSMYPLSYLV